MSKSHYLISLVAAALIFSLPIIASAITLDELNKPTTPDPIQEAFTSTSTPDSNTRPSDTAIGGTRTLKVDKTAGGAGLKIRSDIPGVTPGFLTHSQDSGVKGITTITWDGDNNPNTLTPDGLGGVDFTNDGGTELRIKVLEEADTGTSSLVRFTMVVYDSSSPTGDKFSILTKEITQDVPLGQFQLIQFPFASFQQGATAIAPASFQNVGAIRLFIDGSQSSAVDLNIGPVITDGVCVHVPVNGLVKDQCGVCNGNNSSCAGCDGIPNSGTTYDACGVCGGNNTTCSGCDGIPNSGKVFDPCGVCDGNGSSCADCLGVPFGTAVVDKCGVCNGTDACTDCAGTPNGTAVKDACGVCNGNGSSCISCESKDVRPLSFVLDAGAKDQERLIDNVLDRLVKAAPTAANKAYADKAKVFAHETQIRNWNLSWFLPPLERICSPVELCITASNQPIISEYRVNSEKLRKLSLQALAKLRRVEKNAKYYKKMHRRANQFHAINMSNADKVPIEFQTSCG